ncbi:hypothetical protein F2Q70_00011045 [Brassica cretica]|uniref:Uncharacterized protein n=1 Tax=Brassica cretica TaxID=69181 RepID=A0A8S9M9D8_BRACR|nr:hypothetical protein F2Q68_00004152 [Brassica cretica]KAF2614521.1 hypothetical protein F2Q70_00011045 [Brassica cretica]
MPMSCDGDDCLKVAAKESLKGIYLPLSVGNDAPPPAKKAIYGSDRAKLRSCLYQTNCGFHNGRDDDGFSFLSSQIVMSSLSPPPAEALRFTYADREAKRRTGTALITPSSSGRIAILLTCLDFGVREPDFYGAIETYMVDMVYYVDEEVNCKFTSGQSLIYNAVLKAHNSVISAMKICTSKINRDAI